MDFAIPADRADVVRGRLNNAMTVGTKHTKVCFGETNAFYQSCVGTTPSDMDKVPSKQYVRLQNVEDFLNTVQDIAELLARQKQTEQVVSGSLLEWLSRSAD